MANYAQIVQLVAPGNALEGDQVDIVVKVKNLYNQPITIAVSGAYRGVSLENPQIDLPQEAWTPSVADVGAGQIKEFSTSFEMLNEDIFLLVGSYYLGGGIFNLDDQKSVNIALGGGEEPPPPPSKIPWLAIAGIGGAALLGIMLVRR